MKRLQTLMAVLMLILLQSTATHGQQTNEAPPANPGVKPATVDPAGDKKQTSIFVVEPDDKQGDLVRKTVGSLRHEGLVITKTEAEANAQLPGFDHQIAVVLHLLQTESYEKVQGFIKGLADLRPIRPLRLRFEREDSGPSFVIVEAGGQVRTGDVQVIRDYIRKQSELKFGDVVFVVEGRRVTIPEGTATNPADLPFRLTLLKVKPDWSAVPGAKEIDTELRAVLKDASLPQELLDQLPASGPKIFFAPEIVSFYSPEQYAQFLAWLKSKDLIVESAPFGILQSESEQAKQQRVSMLGAVLGLPPGARGEVMAPRYGATQALKYDFVDLEPIRDPVSQPFLSREPQFIWHVALGRMSGNPITKVEVIRTLSIWEKARGSDTATQTEVLDRSEHQFPLEDKSVAVINLFSDAGERVYRAAANRKGFEGVLVIESSPELSTVNPVKPQLQLPVRVITLPRTTAISGGPLSPLQPKGTPWGGRGGMPGGNRTTAGDRGGPTSAQPTVAQQLAQSATSTTGTPIPPPKPSGEADGEVSVVLNFAFKHVDANAAAKVAQNLFPKENLLVIPDPGGKLLLARGNREVIGELQKVFAQIDGPPANTSQAPAGKQIIASDLAGSGMDVLQKPAAVPVDQLRQEYTTAEQRSLDLAAIVREMETDPKPQSARYQELRNELQEAVKAAFSARQQLLQAEVAEFQQRALGIQQSIQLRNRIQDKIVERRMSDLLNPDLKWEARQVTPPNPARPVPPMAKASPQVQAPHYVDGPQVQVRPSVDETVNIVGKPTPSDVGLENPGSAVVWIELKYEVAPQKGPFVPQAAYVNGCAVSADGLIVSVFRETEGLNIRSATVTYGNQGSTKSFPARVVGHDPQSGLLLLQSEVRNSVCLTLDTSALAIAQRVSLLIRREEGGYETAMGTIIAQLPQASPASAAEYRLKVQNIPHAADARQSSAAGAAIVNRGRLLQGMLAGQLREAGTPETTARVDPAPRDYDVAIIPASAIAKFVDDYRARAQTDPKNPPAPKRSKLSPDLDPVVAVPRAAEPPDTASNVSALSYRYSDSAVVNLEVHTPDFEATGKDSTRAQYLGGAVLNNQGLIVSAWHRDLREADVLSGIRLVNVSFADGPPKSAKVVAYDPTYGTLLLQMQRTTGKPLMHLTLSDDPPALSQELTCKLLSKVMGKLEVSRHDLTVVSVAPTTSTAAGQFLVDRNPSTWGEGAPLLNHAGFLQAVLADWDVPPPLTGPPGGPVPKRELARARFIPASAVRILVDRYAAGINTADPLQSDKVSPSKQAKPAKELQKNSPDPGPSQDSQQQDSKAPAAESVQCLIKLFDVEKKSVARLVGKDLSTSNAAFVPVTPQFESVLVKLVESKEATISSEPIVKTLIGQSATIEIGQQVGPQTNQGGPRVPLYTGTKIEVLPRRLPDSKMELEIAAQISKPSTLVKGVNDVPAGVNSRAFNVTVPVPADGQVLFACPDMPQESSVVTFLYICVIPTDREVRSDPPPPLAPAVSR